MPIIDAVNELSSVDPEGAALQAARALGISFGDSLPDEDPFHLGVDQENQGSATETMEDEDEMLVSESV